MCNDEAGELITPSDPAVLRPFLIVSSFLRRVTPCGQIRICICFDEPEPKDVVSICSSEAKTR